MKKKIKLKKCTGGIIIKDSDIDEETRNRVVERLAERLIEEGFVSFSESRVAGYRFIDAKIYALKQIE